MQGIITVTEVEEWIPSAAALDLEWLCRCHGCSGPERTYKHSQQALKEHQQQRRTRGTMEISRGMHGITFEVVRTVQQERERAKRLLAKAADALVW